MLEENDDTHLKVLRFAWPTIFTTLVSKKCSLQNEQDVNV